jgi:hypothetical protein
MIYYTLQDLDNITIVQVDENGAALFIPLDAENRHYAEYLKWLEEGNEAQPYNPS